MSNRQLIQRPQRLVVTKVDEPAFKVGGSYIPVSRDIHEADREVIIRDLRKVDYADAIGRVCVFGFAGLVVTLLVCLLIVVTVVSLRTGA